MAGYIKFEDINIGDYVLVSQVNVYDTWREVVGKGIGDSYGELLLKCDDMKDTFLLRHGPINEKIKDKFEYDDDKFPCCVLIFWMDSVRDYHCKNCHEKMYRTDHERC